MILTWLSDIHLNFLTKDNRLAFYERTSITPGDIVISGDIAEADCIHVFLREFAKELQELNSNKTIYFVLGNHDYYRGSIDGVRTGMNVLKYNAPRVIWLTGLADTDDNIMLDDNTMLVGVDGFADARYGNYDKSGVRLNDSFFIEELSKAYDKGKQELAQAMQFYADRDTLLLNKALKRGINNGIKRYVIVTHVPPFSEVSLYRGKVANDDFLPFYTNKSLGDNLRAFSHTYPDVHITVLCGHTHHAAQMSEGNLHVRVAGAEYGLPDINEVTI